jgi:hypothetical protein
MLLSLRYCLCKRFLALLVLKFSDPPPLTTKGIKQWFYGRELFVLSSCIKGLCLFIKQAGLCSVFPNPGLRPFIKYAGLCPVFSNLGLLSFHLACSTLSCLPKSRISVLSSINKDFVLYRSRTQFFLQGI